MILKSKIRTRIKLLRAELKITQEELAQMVGVSWATVARWEKKNGTIPSPMARAKLEELGLLARDRVI